ncbi:hypothetical protein HELRODRAFT_193816 [Helobdella robusta]|uniref:Histone deacetylase complex subunit SAP130 C-terminal domain-containing protein n=1 Tax=Helobdella robusta TaxID=6412 RepID=T1FVE0_HELRO|nr:hypothetical protein HELRODRAFT_193816 [Helobdella robusta]ESN94044.1 hypothetical protein HELRODRAFT_193816 [Helobdella robusta]
MQLPSPQFIQLHQQQQLLATPAIQQQLRNMANSSNQSNLVPLQSANTMLLGANYNIIQASNLSGSSVLQDKFLVPQTTHSVQTIMIPPLAAGASKPSSIISGNLASISIAAAAASALAATTSTTITTFPSPSSSLPSSLSSPSLTLNQNTYSLQQQQQQTVNNTLNNNSTNNLNISNKTASLYYALDSTSNQHGYTFIAANAEFNLLQPTSSCVSSNVSSNSSNYNNYNNNSINDSRVNNETNVSTNASSSTPSKQQNQSPRPPILRKRTHEPEASFDVGQSFDITPTNDGTQKLGHGTSLDRNKVKSSKVNVVSVGNKGTKVGDSYNDRNRLQDEGLKVNPRKKPRKQTFSHKQQQQQQHQPPNFLTEELQCQETMALEGLSSEGENDDGDVADCNELPSTMMTSKNHHQPSHHHQQHQQQQNYHHQLQQQQQHHYHDSTHLDNNDDSIKENSGDRCNEMMIADYINNANAGRRRDMAMEAIVDAEGYRWTKDKIRSKVSLSNQYQCTWKPRNNHFISYNDIKIKDDRKPSLNDVANQRGVMHKICGYKLHLVSGHFDELKKDEESVLSLLDELKCLLTPESSNNISDTVNNNATTTTNNNNSSQLNTNFEGRVEDWRSVDDLILANEQRCRKCMEHCDELQFMMLKTLNGKAKAAELIYKNQSRRAVKKKDRS